MGKRARSVQPCQDRFQRDWDEASRTCALNLVHTAFMYAGHVFLENSSIQKALAQKKLDHALSVNMLACLAEMDATMGYPITWRMLVTVFGNEAAADGYVEKLAASIRKEPDRYRGVVEVLKEKLPDDRRSINEVLCSLTA